jgi:hypothetical protein
VSGDVREDFTKRRPGGDDLRGAPSGESRMFTAFLPNGRVVGLRVAPPLASAAEVRHLRRDYVHGVRWRRATTWYQSRAIARLADTLAADVERLNEARLARLRRRRRRLFAGFAKRDRAITKAVEVYRARLERQMHIEREAVRRLGRRDFWDKIVIASAFPLFMAYADRGRIAGPNNIALFVLLLVWLVGDEIVDALFGSEDTSPYPLHDTDAWSYIAPFANVLAGWWLLDDRQHERFVAGRAAFPLTPIDLHVDPGVQRSYRFHATIDLSTIVARGHFADFATFTDVPVVAALNTVTLTDDGVLLNARVGSVQTELQDGLLGLTVTVTTDDNAAVDVTVPILKVLEAAWIVDTERPAPPVLPS